MLSSGTTISITITRITTLQKYIKREFSDHSKKRVRYGSLLGENFEVQCSAELCPACVLTGDMNVNEKNAL